MKALEEYLKANYQSSSLTGYLHGIRIYLEWCGAKAERAGYADVLDYLKWLRKKQLHPSTLGNYLAAVKSYYDFLLQSGRRADHPCATLTLKDRFDRSIHLEELYTPEQLSDLENNYTCKDEKLLKRNRVIIGLLVHQALTVRELAGLEVEDIDLSGGQVEVPVTGLNRGRRLPLRSEQIVPLQIYLESVRPVLAGQSGGKKLILNKHGKPLDPHGISRIINAGRKDKQRFLPRKIRQSVIYHLLKKGNDLRVVQVFAGHRRISSTEAYQQDELDELRRGIQKHHPLR